MPLTKTILKYSISKMFCAARISRSCLATTFSNIFEMRGNFDKGLFQKWQNKVMFKQIPIAISDKDQGG